MAKYQVNYSYKRPDKSPVFTQSTVNAESESTAIRMIEDKHPGCEVSIRSIKVVK